MTIARARRRWRSSARASVSGASGIAASAAGQPILINNLPFTVVGVTPPEFFGVDPAAAPDVYLPLHANRAAWHPSAAPASYLDRNYYWIEMMGRLRPGVGLDQAQAALAPAFPQWVASTAANDRGARKPSRRCRSRRAPRGLDSLRRSTRSRCMCCWRWWV